MPLYQYACSSCAATIERRQTFDEPPLEECPQCGGRLKKVLQPVGVIFKGSGWYCTDSRPKQASCEESGCKSACEGAKTAAA